MPPLFSRVSDPWGVTPPKKIPGVTPGYFWPSLNDINILIVDFVRTDYLRTYGTIYINTNFSLQQR